MVYVYIGLCIYMLYTWMGRSKSDAAKNFFLLSGSVIFSLFIMECALSVTGSYKTYTEKISGDYVSPYNAVGENYYHVWKYPGQPHRIHKLEYCYDRPTNSLGFADSEWTIPKQPHEKRILALGNSFTEGDGAPYDSTYGSILAHTISASGHTAYVMNAGTCGSDPFFNFVNLRDRLLRYRPDIVILPLGSNEMTSDLLIRGGMERFQKDSTIRYTSGPWWEPIYALSYISRVFFRKAGYSEMLRKGPISNTEIEKINKNVIQLMDEYVSLSHKHGIHLYIVLHPLKTEIENNRYDFDFSPILSGVRSDPNVTVTDLLPYYRDEITETNTLVSAYFWPIDGHPNSRGYKVMADGVFHSISPYLMDSTAR
jgi:lysophospholipase L1-like esterase